MLPMGLLNIVSEIHASIKVERQRRLKETVETIIHVNMKVLGETERLGRPHGPVEIHANTKYLERQGWRRLKRLRRLWTSVEIHANAKVNGD